MISHLVITVIPMSVSSASEEALLNGLVALPKVRQRIGVQQVHCLLRLPDFGTTTVGVNRLIDCPHIVDVVFEGTELAQQDLLAGRPP